MRGITAPACFDLPEEIQPDVLTLMRAQPGGGERLLRLGGEQP